MTHRAALPAPTTDAVVAWLLGGGARSWPDDDARPLGEQASPRYSSAPRWEEVRAFGDSRDASGLPCNVAALAQLHATWPVLLASLAGLFTEKSNTLARVLLRVSAGVRLAPLLALRTGAPVHVATAALHKVTLGFSDVCAALLLEQRADADQPPPGGAALHAVLRERPWLIGSAQVCAGSRAQITRVWDALNETGSTQPIAELDAPWFVTALTALLELEALTAASAGAAREALLRGQPTGALSHALFTSAEVPQWAEALRQVPGAGPAYPSLLFASTAVPASLQCFVNRVAMGGDVDADAALLDAAKDPAERLMRALGIDAPSEVSAAAFLGSCSGGEPALGGSLRESVEGRGQVR